MLYHFSRSSLLVAVILFISNCEQQPTTQIAAAPSNAAGAGLQEQNHARDELAFSDDHPSFQPCIVAFSPYDLARRINANERRYKQGKSLFEPDLNSVWNEIGVESGYFDQADGSMHVRVTRARLDRDRTPEVLLKITLGYDFCRYVIFKRHTSVAGGVKGTWLVVGVLDHKFNRYKMVSDRTVSSAGEHFLILRGQTGSGSGFSRYEDAWFRLDSRGVRRVLSYDAAGHESPWPCGLDRELSSAIVPIESEHGTAAFDVRLRLQFSYVNEQFRTLADVSRRVRIEWDAKAYRLRLDPSASQVSEERIATVFSLEDYEPLEGRALLAEHWGSRAKGKLAKFDELVASCDRLMDDMAKRRKDAN
jgi:hypothetical protein